MRMPFDDIKQELKQILESRDCPADKAEQVAREMTRNSLEGTYTHGINRFARLIRNIDKGIVDVHASPALLHAFGAIENYDGQMGLGVPNAIFGMDRAIALAREHGIGLVAMRNTNHWMRAATYGLQACEAGMAGLCTTNTIPNMPTWGAKDSRLGNNPLVLAFPRKAGPVVVDMAMSQFSYGALELAKLEDRQMPIDAGFAPDGSLTRDPSAVLATRRPLPTGYWKGAGLSFLLDVFVSCMSLGNSIAGISRLEGDEHGLSQLFIAIHYSAIAPEDQAAAILEDNLDFLLASQKASENDRITYPGAKAVRVRAENLTNGIPVDERIWNDILSLVR